MNVLYVPSTGNQATLLHGDQMDTAPLGNLKALAARLKAKGSTILVVDAAIQATELPVGLLPQNIPPYLDSRHGGFAVPAAQAQPTLVQVIDGTLLASIRAAAKSAGLRLTHLVPFSAAAAHLAGPEQSMIIVHQTMATYELAILSPADPPSSRSLSASERNTPAQVVKAAASRIRSRNDDPRIVLVSDEGKDLEVDDDHLVLSLRDVLQQATKPYSPADEQGEQVFPAVTVAGMTRSLTARASLDKRLFVALALAAAINGGLYVATTIVGGQAQALTTTRDSLTTQAAEVDALQTANQKLVTSNEQARTIIENKGPLAQDLPLVVGRITELPATLSSLSGPNNATADDTRAFGETVQRTYDLSATTTRVEDLTRAYQERGLRADVRNIDCSTPRCVVTFRAAPVPLATTSTTPTTTPTTGGATTPAPVTP